MTQFRGRFITLRGEFGEPASGLEGPGAIRFESSGIVLLGTKKRTRLSSVIAAIIGGLVGMAVLFVSVFGRVRFEGPGLPAIFCVLAVVGVYIAVRAILVRALPTTPVEVAIDFPFIVRVNGDTRRLVLLTSSPDLAGLSVLETTDALQFLEELELARRKQLPGYREPGHR